VQLVAKVADCSHTAAVTELMEVGNLDLWAVGKLVVVVVAEVEESAFAAGAEEETCLDCVGLPSSNLRVSSPCHRPDIAVARCSVAVRWDTETAAAVADRRTAAAHC
jgi:hypothetical protein